MCQAGINTTDYKLAIHQLAELAKLAKTNSEQWARLAESWQQAELSTTLGSASDKLAEAIALFEQAMDDVHDHHTHVHIS